MAVQLHRRRFTVDEYERLALREVLGEDARIELIDGEIVEMSPIGPAHMSRLNQAASLFYRIVGDEAIVSVQNPIRLPPYGEPQPDIAVLRRDYAKERVPEAADVLLGVEIADSTLETDRKVKMPLYAAAGIAEAWLFDVQSRVIERHTDPLDGTYRQVAAARRGQALASTVLPRLTIGADLIFE